MTYASNPHGCIVGDSGCVQSHPKHVMSKSKSTSSCGMRFTDMPSSISPIVRSLPSS